MFHNQLWWDLNQISHNLLGEGEVKFLERDSLACVSLLERAICEQKVTSLVGIILSFSHDSCKVEFNQPSCRLYFVPNFLVI